MTDKQIIVTFSDGYCIVLENNKVSIRENDFTKYRIVVGDRTNELLEFVKDTYLQLKAKEQECESWKTLIDQAQIEQRKLEQQLEAYKMEAEEGKEINAELEAENKELKEKLKEMNEVIRTETTRCSLVNSLKTELDQLKAESKEINEKLKEKFSEYTLKTSFVTAFQDNLLNKYKQILTDIEDIISRTDSHHPESVANMVSVIRRRISEVENGI